MMILLATALALTDVGQAASAPSLEIAVEYNASADLFHLLDQVSNWWPGFCDFDYRDYWDRHIAYDPRDAALFARYTALRRAHGGDPDQEEKDPKRNRHGLFGWPQNDRIASAFYGTHSQEEAFAKLQPLLSPTELAFMKAFHAHFLSRARPLLDESEKFSAFVDAYRATLGAGVAEAFVHEMQTFFGDKTALTYRVLFVWWPPVGHSTATPVGGHFLLMRYNPLKAQPPDASVVFHEIAHAISSQQSVAQKRALTRAFLEQCDIGAKFDNHLEILEEPMAAAIGQLIYAQRSTGDFSQRYSRELYDNPWIDLFARLIFPILRESFDTHRPFDAATAAELGRVCHAFAARYTF